jgi:hypothetical protein
VGCKTYLGDHSLEGSRFGGIERSTLLPVDRAIQDALAALEWADFCWRAGQNPNLTKRSLRRHRAVLLKNLDKLPPAVRARVERLGLLDTTKKHLFR